MHTHSSEPVEVRRSTSNSLPKFRTSRMSSPRLNHTLSPTGSTFNWTVCPYSTACARARAFMVMKVFCAPLVAKRPEMPLKLFIAMLVRTDPTMSTTTSSMSENPDLRFFISLRSLRRCGGPRWTLREIRAIREPQ